MANGREQWEGRTVDGKYRLNHYLGGSGGLAVFRTLVGDRPTNAVIKIIPLEDADAKARWLCWQRASDLNHPNVLRILAVGRAVMDGRESYYTVEEFAEENLGQIGPDRALTPEEARAMLGSVLAALEYVHGRGLVHGSIRPANILAIGDQVKLSSGSLRERGAKPRSFSPYDAPEVAAQGISVASDVWALGMTLAEVMTQHAPVWDAARMSSADLGAEIPEPFRTIVGRCLETNPAKRCDLREIVTRLEPAAVAADAPKDTETVAPAVLEAPKPKVPEPGVPHPAATWRHWIIPAVAIAAMAIFLVRQHSSKTSREGSTAAVQQAPADTRATQPEPAQPPVNPTRPEPQEGTHPASGAARKGRAEAAPDNDVVQQVMPEVIPSARRTIQGRIRVRVNVNVGPDGGVKNATLEAAGPSKYFARVALEAARRWKFVSTENKSEERKWTLQFSFTRERTSATAARRH